MTELEKIEYTKGFIDKLATGINPLDDTPIPDGDLTNHVRLSRCFFYVSDILRRVIENGGITAPEVRTTRQKKPEKQVFILSEEVRATLQASEDPVSVSEIAKHLNELIDQETMKKISAAKINQWLLEQGFLKTIKLANNKQRRTPTQQGSEIGIFTEERNGQYGKYIAVLFSSSAQQFVYDHIDVIAKSLSEEDEAVSEN
jgi:predicted Zn-ribbon and HTH transcriptional regulator